MKVLFYPLIDHSLVQYPLQMCDYMNDCVFHGLRSLLGQDLVDMYPMAHMYNNYNQKLELYGNGFTIFGKLDLINTDRNNLEEKIKNKYFDQIIVCIHNNRFRTIEQNIKEIKELKKYGNVLKIIDGNDHADIYTELIEYGLLFKRELLTHTTKVLPISFGVPKDYIVDSTNIDNKTKVVSDILPVHGGKTTWKYTIEDEYRQQYKYSLFAHTCKKGGWDCLRHYEIIGNGCLPVFQNIEECPLSTLTTLPKETLYRIHQIWQNHEQHYNELKDIAEHLITYAKEFLTTEHIARKILTNE